MQHPQITFFLHIDKKSEIKEDINKCSNVIILPDHLRVDVRWAGITQIDATLNLMRYAEEYDQFDYYWLCSGQDFPIRPINELIAELENNHGSDYVDLFKTRNHENGKDNNYDKRTAIYFPEWMIGNEPVKRFLKRAYTQLTGGYEKTYFWARRKPINDFLFYFGSQWICLSEKTLKWIDDYLEEHPEYYTFYRNTNCPDESFFHTLVMNSPYAKCRRDHLYYIDWSQGGNSPKLLTCDDLDKIIGSGKYMARKFDANVDSEVLNVLSKRINI